MKNISSYNPKVLVILPSAQDRKELTELECQGYKFDYFEDKSWRAYEPALNEFDPILYATKCIDKVKNNHFDAIFYSDDFPSLIASAVAEEFDLLAPSIDATFRCNHKLYTRLAERNPIDFEGFTFDTNDKFNKLNFPCHVKPASLSFSVLQATVRSNTQFQSIVNTIKEKLPLWERPFIEFYKKYVDVSKFPLAHSNLYLVEEFVEAVSQHAVEGWTDGNGKQFIWAISDNNYGLETGSALDNNSVPSRLPNSILNSICEVALDTVDRIGLKNGFWNVELWVKKNGKIQVTEVNGRIIASMTPLYHKVFGKSQYAAALKLACNQPLDINDIPESAQGVGAMFAISTSSQGYVRDLINLEKIPQVSQMEGVIKFSLLYAPDAFISWQQFGGKCCVARAWIVGNTFENIEATANEIRRIILNTAK